MKNISRVIAHKSRVYMFCVYTRVVTWNAIDPWQFYLCVCIIRKKCRPPEWTVCVIISVQAHAPGECARRALYMYLCTRVDG